MPKKATKRTSGKITTKKATKKKATRKAIKKTVVKTVPKEKRTYKDLLLAYHDTPNKKAAVEALTREVESGEYSDITIRRAVTLLNEQDRDIGNLGTYLKGTIARGKAPPKVGEVRTYRVQRPTKGKKALYIRLPVETLGITSADEIKVSFADNKIEVQIAK
jgi:hypothetical protein